MKDKASPSKDKYPTSITPSKGMKDSMNNQDNALGKSQQMSKVESTNDYDFVDATKQDITEEET